MKDQSVWKFGDQILLREDWKGRTWALRPVTVIEDSENLIALFFQNGTHWKKPLPLADENLAEILLRTKDWNLVEDIWEKGNTLILIKPGEAYALHAMWDTHRKFIGWYVNMQEPLRRTASGFDYMDHILDIVVKPDLSDWQWKDSDDFDEAVQRGLYSTQQAMAIRRKGEQVIAKIKEKAPPFLDGWENWKSPPGWTIPTLPG